MEQIPKNNDLDIVNINEDEIPWYRWRWFFLITFLFLSPISILIGLTGDVYARDGDSVSKLPDLTKKLILIAGVFLLIGNINRFM